MKTVFITGASSGIGKETAVLFAKKGWNVAATMRKRERLSMFADSKNIKTFLLDVTDTDSIRTCLRDVLHFPSSQYTIHPNGLLKDSAKASIMN